MKKPIMPTLDLKPLELIEEDTPLELGENVRYVNEMRGQRDVLLRVARAVKEDRRVHKVIDGTTVGTIFDMQFATREVDDALKEAEDLGIL